ncbi:MAG: hypothetical protein A3I03_15950 [Candidatus Rokubacteria bacterium RIFCSPLOWO2_02_FULL_68_19]|nr:MAG: hypothetical protein A3I03_15950 [Candidatus Rokubacteria bacterium RIFCSPLOWO2_02_FULL_68_19]
MALFVGLGAGRPSLLVHGVAAGIERHAAGGEAGILGGEIFGGQFFSIDFYLGRPLRPLQTVGEFRKCCSSGTAADPWS